MKKYSDLQAIDTDLDLRLELEATGMAIVTVDIQQCWQFDPLIGRGQISERLALMQPFRVQVQSAGTVTILSLQIDGIDLIPRFNHLVDYPGGATNVIHGPGHWILDIDRPFYHWLHEHTGQGWLLS